MSTISPALVRELRDLTSAPMMDCKKALEATGGNIEEASQLLRKQYGASAAKKSSRETNFKVSAIAIKKHEDKEHAYVATVSCETDFVARNPMFADLALAVLSHFIHTGNEQIDQLMEHTSAATENMTLKSYIESFIGKLGENIKIISLHKIEAKVINYYMHNKLSDHSNVPLENVGMLLSIVGLDSFENLETAKMTAKNIAMHSASTAPLALNVEQFPLEALEKERAFLLEKAKEEFAGKPEAVMQNALKGRENKFLSEKVLEKQAFIMDSSITVKEYAENNKTSLAWFKLI